MRGLTRKIISCGVVIAGAWCIGLGWFVFQIPTHEQDSKETTDAIVVLTGDSGRIEAGLRLLLEDRGKKLFISGAGSMVTPADVIKNVPEELRSALAYRTVDIVLGHYAQNTIGNAEETASWLKRQHYTSIRLVTSSYHMPRSLEEVRQTMPGIKIIPEPVFTEGFSLGKVLTDKESWRLLMSEYHKYLAAKLRHLALYIMSRK